MALTVNDIDYHDTKTWELIQSGFAGGVFQCESKLVQNWLKKIKPKNIWELSIVIAIVRPGPLMSGYAERLVENKNSGRIQSFNNEIVDSVLSSTFGIPCFQEQLMFLGSKLAWPHLPAKERDLKVDNLRKAVGKKNQAKILEIGALFVEGCVANQVPKELADKLFELIKNSGRYAFNLSHSIAYAHVAYKTAWLKTNFPKEFFTTYFDYAEESQYKWDDIKELSNECKIFGIDFLSPNINSKNANFAIEGNAIRYGLSHMKYGPSMKLMETIVDLPRIDSWQKFIIFTMTDRFGDKPRSNTVESLIWTGAFHDTGLSRSTLYGLYDLFSFFTDKELEQILQKLNDTVKIEDLKGFLHSSITKINIRRKSKVDSKIEFFKIVKDHPSTIADKEQEILGTIISASSVDGKMHDAYHTCVECFGDIPENTKKRIAVVINEVIPTITKKGQNPGQKMARITVSDSSGSLENLPVFPNLFQQIDSLLIPRNTVTLDLNMGKNGWIIQNVQQI